MVVNNQAAVSGQGAMAQIIGQETEEMLREAIERRAEEIVGYRHYNGAEAMREFNLTRRDLTKISPTRLSGRRKPVYLFKHIKAYKDKQTTFK